MPPSSTQAPPNIYSSTSSWLLNWVWMGAALYCIVMFGYWAYRIRMGAIEEYGPVIHEFDPYFNYRATEYLYHNGAKKFLNWFDYMVWYPLGRPVGTTIYPGMQFTAVWLKRYVLTSWSLNDVCCYIPAWFGAIASFAVGCIAYECTIPINTNSNLFRVMMDLINGEQTELKPVVRPLALGFTSPALECGIFAMGMMAIVPAHLMRSVGGGYDNESVATSAMTLTFYFWVRSLRNTESNSYLIYGALTGLAYFYMVAAWGGYVFVLNLIGVHAGTLVLMGRFSDKVYASYSLFYVIGTSLAIQIPVVGWSPLKSLEQLGPCAVFLGYQLIQFCEVIKRRQNMNRVQAWKLRVQVFGAAAVVGLAFIWVMAPTGYFGPISSRVRGLFVQHTKTGNPLVDSVAEHQPASNRAYFQYLHHVCSLAPIGYFMLFTSLSDSSSFLVVWGTAAYFFSHRMVRLILLTGPIGSALGGIAVGRGFAWCVRQLWDAEGYAKIPLTQYAEFEPSSAPNGKVKDGARKQQRKGKKYATASSTSSFDGLTSLMDAFDTAGKSKEGIFMKRVAAAILLLVGYIVGMNFINYCWRLSVDLSNPTIIMKARLRDGRIIKVDDYREAYWWLRDNTPEDSRIMAWWDYGYQITAIANRTTLADGNTWNHEHIALLGKALTTDIEEGYEIARHLADYVLIWGGGGGDDLAKSPHLARIANSVYRDMCPDDPTCRSFGFIDRNGTPSKMMEKSLLYKLHGHQLRPGVEADPEKFKEVYRSKYGRVRIFKILGISEESKEWVANPANRKCDAPGSWFCPGQYPPGLSNILSRKRDFAQLEDFNRGSSDEDYSKQYLEALKNPEIAQQKAQLREQKEARAEEAKPREIRETTEPKKDTTEQRKVAVDEIYNTWEDTDETTAMWKLITSNQVQELKEWLEQAPTAAFVRSKDGRGPMWWAFESRNQEIVKMLMMAGVPHTDRDSRGLTPVDLLEGGMKQ